MDVPVFSSKKDVEIIEVKDRDAFCVHHLVMNNGLSNLYIEKSE